MHQRIQKHSFEGHSPSQKTHPLPLRKEAMYILLLPWNSALCIEDPQNKHKGNNNPTYQLYNYSGGFYYKN